jgi:hypothetical protein
MIWAAIWALNGLMFLAIGLELIGQAMDATSSLLFRSLMAFGTLLVMPIGVYFLALAAHHARIL